MKKNILKNSYGRILLLYCFLHLLVYCVFYQMDYYIFSLSGNCWMVKEAQIIDTRLYEGTTRRTKPVVLLKRAIIEYEVNGKKYQSESFMSFDEKKGDIINIAVKKNNFSKMRRCELLKLSKGIVFMNYISIIIILILKIISIIQEKIEKRKKHRMNEQC